LNPPTLPQPNKFSPTQADGRVSGTQLPAGQAALAGVKSPSHLDALRQTGASAQAKIGSALAPNPPTQSSSNPSTLQRKPGLICPPVDRLLQANSQAAAQRGGAPPVFHPIQSFIGQAILRQSPKLIGPPVYRPVQAPFSIQRKIILATAVQRSSLVNKPENSGIRSGAGLSLRPAASHPFAILRARGNEIPSNSVIQRAMLTKEQEDELVRKEFADYPRQAPTGFPPVGVNLANLDGDDQDIFDRLYKGVQIRASFKSGIYESLKALQSATGKFLCFLPGCPVNGGVIALDSNGKEDYAKEKCGPYERVTKPHIDHFNPDWRDRLQKIVNRGLSATVFQTEVEAAYNAPPLRILHKACNLTRPK